MKVARCAAQDVPQLAHSSGVHATQGIVAQCTWNNRIRVLGRTQGVDVQYVCPE